MSKYVPPGFDAAKVTAGISKAMGFGEPTRTEDKAWFYFPTTRVSTDLTPPATDQDGVPFDLTAQVTPTTTKARLLVQCAVEYLDAQPTPERFGELTSSHIKITLMDADYQKVKGFSYVVAGGDKYLYQRTEPPVALGTIDFWFIHCTAEDDR